jgi:hypothetical protein
MPPAAPDVLLLSLSTQQGVDNIVLAMTRRDVVKPAFSLRKQRYVKTHALSLPGTKNLHSAEATFQDFQRRQRAESLLKDAQYIEAQVHEQVGHVLMLFGDKGGKDTEHGFRQGGLFDLELLYDFRPSLFVEALGIMDRLKQLTLTQFMH